MDEYIPALELIGVEMGRTLSVRVITGDIFSRGSRGGNNDVTNTTSFLAKDVSIPNGSSLELLSGGKVVLEATDSIRIDCSVADKLSGTLSIMEIT